MALPKFLQPYLASYDLAKLNADDSSVSHEIVTEVLNRGDVKAVRWIFEKYPIQKIRSVIKDPTRGTWLKRSLSYWQKIFGVEIPKEKFQRAILNLNPYAASSNFKPKSN